MQLLGMSGFWHFSTVLGAATSRKLLGVDQTYRGGLFKSGAVQCFLERNQLQGLWIVLMACWMHNDASVFVARTGRCQSDALLVIPAKRSSTRPILF